MPLYSYTCSLGHTTDLRAGLDQMKIACPYCPERAYRHACYPDQYVFTESGGRGGRLGRAGKLTESQERYARNSNTIEKETGIKSGIGLR